MPFTVLTDKTEARYAEIGRIMYETGDYITPMVDYNEPFWGKPPLSFWSTALSYKIFGVNEFAAHLPHFLFLAGIILLMYFFVKKHLDDFIASMSSAILASFSMYLYTAGGVMTDPALLFSVTIALIVFYNSISSDRSTLYGFLFFIGAALALLAKGPIGVIIIGMPCVLYAAVRNKWRCAWNALPWIPGTLAGVAIALPWYILAELKTPGFLNYFILGEHFKRFLVAGWDGDLYGYPSEAFIGVIFLYYFICTIPWSPYLIIKLFDKNFRSILLSVDKKDKEFLLYIKLCILTPLLFFIFSKNIIITYALPALPPSSVLFAYWLHRFEPTPLLGKFKVAFIINTILLVLMICLELIAPSLSLSANYSDKYAISEYKKFCSKDEPLYYFDLTRPYSAAFYTHGKAKRIDDLDEFLQEISKYSKDVYVIMKKSTFNSTLFDGFEVTGILDYRKNKLLRFSKIYTDETTPDI